MRKLLNTLYVTTPEAYLAKDGENILVLVGDEERFRVPVHNIEGIVCFGYTGASPALMGLCAERNIPISFLTEHGYFLGRITGPVSGNILLRRRQYRLADDELVSLSIGRICIAGKINNCRTVLQRAIRDHGSEVNKPAIEEAVNILSTKQKQALKASSVERLRGIEGETANTYFGVFDHLILKQKDDFYMRGRNRRPPTDRVNTLLSFIYVLLMHEVRSSLESVGLDPCVGFLHTDRPGRPSLALDMMEEFRPYLADRLVLSLINRNQVTGKGFIEKGVDGILMSDDTRKEVLAAWQKRKKEEIQHPYLETTIPVGLLPYAQALLMARYIRGDIDNYPVFINK